MEIRILGDLVVCRGHEKIPLGTPKQQIVFAMLAVEPGRLVTVDEMVDELWPEHPPKSAVPNVRSYAANLRRALDTAAGGEAAIVRQQGGYRLTVTEELVDLVRLTAQFAEARDLACGGEDSKAASLLAGVERNWSGSLLAGLPLGPGLSARREAVERERDAAIELLADLHIRTGRSDLAVTLLRSHSARHYTRERAQMLLMRALIATKDVDGAIAVYRATRTALGEQLGVAPSEELEQIYRSALGLGRIHGGLQRNAAGVGTSRPPAPGRRGLSWLPRIVTDFVGRKRLVVKLLREIAESSQHGSVVQVIDGMAGCGKTTLAVHLAEQLAPEYPDAQLFVDLRGHGDAPPMAPAAILFTLLRQLGVPAGRVPSDVNDRIDLWRRELEQRRLVIILDNAASSEQVLPLLPAGAGAVVLVTARTRLFAAELGVPEPLSVMELDEAVRLLEVTAGSSRISAEPAAAEEVVRRCGHLPLAIRLAGARLAHRPNWQVADLARQLTDGQGWISQLVIENRTVAGAFATSYEPLSKGSQFAFRMLAIHPGNDFSLPMAAALADLPLGETAVVMDDLVDRHLVEETGSGRYRLHDLMREYARELSRQVDDPEVGEAASARLLDLCLRATLAVAVPLEPTLDAASLAPGPAPRPDLFVALGPPDVEWLEHERSNLSTLVVFAAEIGHDQLAWRLARAMWRFCYMRSYFDDILLTNRHGLMAAQRIGDRAVVAQMKNYVASAYVRIGDYRTAKELVEGAVATYQELGEPAKAARYRANLSAIYWFTGDLDAALRMGAEMLLDQRLRRSDEFHLVLPNYGIVLTAVGRYTEALHLHRLHLYLGRLKGDQFHLLNALAHIGMVKTRLGHYTSAIRLMQASLRLRDRTGHRYGEAELRVDLGNALRALGRLDEARHHNEVALQRSIDDGERYAQSAALNGLGLTSSAQGRPDEATLFHRRALELATRITHPQEQGRALLSLGDLTVAADPAGARRYWHRALAIFERIGVPERHEVRRRLSETAP